MNEDQYAERIANIEERLRVLRAASADSGGPPGHEGDLASEMQKLADEKEQLLADLADIRESGGFPK